MAKKKKKEKKTVTKKKNEARKHDEEMEEEFIDDENQVELEDKIEEMETSDEPAPLTEDEEKELEEAQKEEADKKRAASQVVYWAFLKMPNASGVPDLAIISDARKDVLVKRMEELGNPPIIKIIKGKDCPIKQRIDF